MFGLVALAATLLVGCGVLNPQEQAAALASIDTLLANKQITPEQHVAMAQLIESQASFQWMDLVNPVVAAALAYFGIRYVPARAPIQREVIKALAVRQQPPAAVSQP